MVLFQHIKWINRSLMTPRIRSILLVLSLSLPTMAWPFSPYSNRELDQLEKEFVEQINRSPLVIRDPMAELYINHLAKRLAQHGQLAQPNFFLVNSNEINAFAGPGGHIGVNTQLILAADNESELAAVMAHEMAHVRLHHLYRMLEHEKQMQIPKLASLLAAIALGVVNPMMGTGALMASLGGFAQDNINFVRSNEKEADRIGIDVLEKSGLDPRGMAHFFKKMQENSRYYYSANVPAILRSHPIDEDRIAEAENRCAQMKLHPVPDNLEFHLFKTLIRTTVVSDNKALLEDYDHCVQSTPNNPVCHYGYALALMNVNRYALAESQLAGLLLNDPNNLYYAIAMSRAESANDHAASSIRRLQVLLANYPDNYAILFALADSLTAANQHEQAASVLLKARRQFPKDLALCEALAQAEAQNHRKNYAYFTEAHCYLLQGQVKEAKRLLKLAQTLTGKDPLMKARIDAKLDEIAE
jgi:predicted Zn-dependent protease